MNVINLSAEPLGKLYSWIPTGLKAERIIFLPDACPGKSPLPTGTAVLTKQKDWRKFALSDCGCGMRLIKSDMKLENFASADWENVAEKIKLNKGKLGDLGGGNHFLDAIVPSHNNIIYFLIHTGSRNESGLVDHLVEKNEEFDNEYSRIVRWAYDNRAKIHEVIESIFGKSELILDKEHNNYEILNSDEVIIRKGSIKLKPDEFAVIPSHLSGDIVLVQAKDTIEEILSSMSHGTGRKFSRSDCKPLADSFDFNELRKKILIPNMIKDESLKTEGPYAYRDLDECLGLISNYVQTIERFKIIAYMGHL